MAAPKTSAGLDDARARVQRAFERRKAITEAVDRFFGRKRKPFRIEKKLNAERTHYVQRFYSTKPVPIPISILIGEAFYNLRSALDHVVYPFGAREFPIVKNKGRFYRLTKSGNPAPGSGIIKIEDVTNKKVRALIEGLQPCHRVNGDPTEHPLWLLSQLRNIDEHRYLHVVAAASRGTYRLPPLPDKESRAEWHYWRGRLEDGTEIASADFNRPQSKVDVDFPFALSVAFNEPEVPSAEFVEEVLDNIASFVRFAVEAFADFY
jgi:hypothetical protein